VLSGFPVGCASWMYYHWVITSPPRALFAYISGLHFSSCYFEVIQSFCFVGVFSFSFILVIYIFDVIFYYFFSRVFQLFCPFFFFFFLFFFCLLFFFFLFGDPPLHYGTVISKFSISTLLPPRYLPKFSCCLYFGLRIAFFYCQTLLGTFFLRSACVPPSFPELSVPAFLFFLCDFFARLYVDIRLLFFLASRI